MSAIDYATLYQALRAREEQLEWDSYRSRPGAELDHDAWRSWWRQHSLRVLEFQRLLWSLSHADDLRDFGRRAGTRTLARAALEVLGEAELLVHGSGGELEWSHPLFPEPAGPRIDECVEPLRPEPSFGQLCVDQASNLRRVDALCAVLPPFGRTVLFLGDDDQTSIHAASRITGRIEVGDIDERVVARVNDTAARHELPLAAERYDIHDPLPQRWQECFDIVHCDPVDEGSWIELWLSRALSALRPSPGALLYLCVSPKRLGPRWLGLQQFMSNSGLVLIERHPDVNCYDARAISDKFHADVDDQFDGALYSDLLIFERRALAGPRLGPSHYHELRRGP